MSTKKRLRLKVIASALTVCFLAGELHAAPLETLSRPSALEAMLRNPELFEAPEDFSTLTEIHPGNSDIFIIHIQDAHSNFSGQDSLANTLDALMKKYGVSLVLSEGGIGDCTLTPIKSVAKPEVWKRVARSFLMNGKLQGEEYLNLVSDHPMKIVGIEDAALYDDSVEAYRALAQRRGAILTDLEKIETAVEKLKNKLYPARLKTYERSKKDGAAFDASFDGFLELAVSASFDLTPYPELEKLAALREKERAINFELANLEQAALVEEVHQKGGADELDASLKRMERIKGNKVALLTHFQNTLNIAKENGVDTARFTSLLKYVDYLREFSKIDLDKFLPAYETAEDALYTAVLGTGDARLLRGVDRFTGLLRTAHEIKMTPDQYALFKANEPDFSVEPMEAFLNRKLAENGYFADLIPAKPVLEEGRQALDAFYASVAARDSAFMKSVEEILKKEGQKIAFLITGGYHTPHLKELFREKGYGYAVLTPAVTSETNQRKYESLLLSQKSPAKKKVHLTEGQGASKDKSLSQADDLAKLMRKGKDGVRPLLAVPALNEDAPDSEQVLEELVTATGARMSLAEVKSRFKNLLSGRSGGEEVKGQVAKRLESGALGEFVLDEPEGLKGYEIRVKRTLVDKVDDTHELTANIFSKDDPENPTNRIPIRILVSTNEKVKAIYVYKFFPQMPEKKKGYGTALLKALIGSYKGYAVLAIGSDEFRGMFKGKAMKEYNPIVVKIKQEQYDPSKGLDETQFREAIKSLPAYPGDEDRSYEPYWRLQWQTTNVYGVVPGGEDSLHQTFQERVAEAQGARLAHGIVTTFLAALLATGALSQKTPSSGTQKNIPTAVSAKDTIVNEGELLKAAIENGLSSDETTTGKIYSQTKDAYVSGKLKVRFTDDPSIQEAAYVSASRTVLIPRSKIKGLTKEKAQEVVNWSLAHEFVHAYADMVRRGSLADPLFAGLSEEDEERLAVQASYWAMDKSVLLIRLSADPKGGLKATGWAQISIDPFGPNYLSVRSDGVEDVSQFIKESLKKTNLPAVQKKLEEVASFAYDLTQTKDPVEGLDQKFSQILKPVTVLRNITTQARSLDPNEDSATALDETIKAIIRTAPTPFEKAAIFQLKNETVLFVLKSAAKSADASNQFGLFIGYKIARGFFVQELNIDHSRPEYRGMASVIDAGENSLLINWFDGSLELNGEEVDGARLAADINELREGKNEGVKSKLAELSVLLDTPLKDLDVAKADQLDTALSSLGYFPIYRHDEKLSDAFFDHTDANIYKVLQGDEIYIQYLQAEIGSIAGEKVTVLEPAGAQNNDTLMYRDAAGKFGYKRGDDVLRVYWLAQNDKIAVLPSHFFRAGDQVSVVLKGGVYQGSVRQLDLRERQMTVQLYDHPSLDFVTVEFIDSDEGALVEPFTEKINNIKADSDAGFLNVPNFFSMQALMKDYPGQAVDIAKARGRRKLARVLEKIASSQAEGNLRNLSPGALEIAVEEFSKGLQSPEDISVVKAVLEQSSGARMAKEKFGNVTVVADSHVRFPELNSYKGKLALKDLAEVASLVTFKNDGLEVQIGRNDDSNLYLKIYKGEDLMSVLNLSINSNDRAEVVLGPLNEAANMRSDEMKEWFDVIAAWLGSRGFERLAVQRSYMTEAEDRGFALSEKDKEWMIRRLEPAVGLEQAIVPDVPFTIIKLAEDITEETDISGQLMGAILRTENGLEVRLERVMPQKGAENLYAMKIYVGDKRVDDSRPSLGTLPGLRWLEEEADGSKPASLRVRDLFLTPEGQQYGKIGKTILSYLSLRADLAKRQLETTTTRNPRIPYLMQGVLEESSILIYDVSNEDDVKVIDPVSFKRLLDEAFSKGESLPYSVKIVGVPRKDIGERPVAGARLADTPEILRLTEALYLELGRVQYDMQGRNENGKMIASLEKARNEAFPAQRADIVPSKEALSRLDEELNELIQVKPASKLINSLRDLSRQTQLLSRKISQMESPQKPGAQLSLFGARLAKIDEILAEIKVIHPVDDIPMGDGRTENAHELMAAFQKLSGTDSTEARRWMQDAERFIQAAKDAGFSAKSPGVAQVQEYLAGLNDDDFLALVKGFSRRKDLQSAEAKKEAALSIVRGAGRAEMEAFLDTPFLDGTLANTVNLEDILRSLEREDYSNPYLLMPAMAETSRRVNGLHTLRYLIDAPFMKERIRQAAALPKNRQQRYSAEKLFELQEELGIFQEAAGLPKGKFSIGQNGRLLWRQSRDNKPALRQKLPDTVELITKGDQQGLFAVTAVTADSREQKPYKDDQTVADFIKTSVHNIDAADAEKKSGLEVIGDGIKLSPTEFSDFMTLVEREIRMLEGVSDEQTVDISTNSNQPGAVALKVYLSELRRIGGEQSAGARMAGKIPVALEEELKDFGITVTNGRAWISREKGEKDWSMNSLRDAGSDPVFIEPKEMPAAPLRYPVEELPVLSDEGTSAEVHLGMADIEGKVRPVAVKTFKYASSNPRRVGEDLIKAQVRGRVGIGPKFYGVIRDKNGSVVGYAMELVRGSVVRPYDDFDPKAPPEDVLKIREKLAAIGMTPGNDFIETPEGRYLSIDEDNTVVNESLYYAFVEQAAFSGARLAESGVVSKSDLALLARIASSRSSVLRSEAFFHFLFADGGIATIGFTGKMMSLSAGSSGVTSTVDLSEAIAEEQHSQLFGEEVVTPSVQTTDSSEAETYGKELRPVLRAAQKFMRQTPADYQGNKTVEFRVVTTEPMTQDRQKAFEGWAQNAQNILGGKILVQFGARLADFESLPGSGNKDEYGIVYMGKMSQGLLQMAAGHGIAATPADSRNDEESLYVGQMLFSTMTQRVDAPVDELKQMWGQLRSNPLTELNPKNFSLLREVKENAQLSQYGDLTFRVMKIAWDAVLQGARMALQAVGSAA